MEGSDIGAAAANRFLLVYIGGNPGTTAGHLYNTQQPTLAFSARWLVAWKLDGSYKEVREWSGSAWTTASWTLDHVVRSGSLVEAAIDRQDLGYPSKLSIHLSMINETNGAEGTFAGVPSTSWVTDGHDKDYSKYFQFDLTSSKIPNTYAPLP